MIISSTQIPLLLLFYLWVILDWFTLSWHWGQLYTVWSLTSNQPNIISAYNNYWNIFDSMLSQLTHGANIFHWDKIKTCDLKRQSSKRIEILPLDFCQTEMILLWFRSEIIARKRRFKGTKIRYNPVVWSDNLVFFNDAQFNQCFGIKKNITHCWMVIYKSSLLIVLISR